MQVCLTEALELLLSCSEWNPIFCIFLSLTLKLTVAGQMNSLGHKCIALTGFNHFFHNKIDGLSPHNATHQL